MPTLASCIRKAGKALNAGDADAIRAIYGELVDRGIDANAAAPQAIEEYLDTLADEQQTIEDQIEEQGGAVGDVLRFSQDNSIARKVARALNISNLLEGDEQLDITPTGGVNQDRVIMRDVANALQQRGRDIDETLQTARDPEAREKLAIALADEVEAAMERSGHAGHWYSDKLRNAVALMAEIHPELATDPDATSMFLAALAITSNGQPVEKNSQLADEMYSEYKRTGKFPTDRGVGKEAQGMNTAFQKLNELISTLGVTDTRKFLATGYTKRQLKDLGYENVAGSEPVSFQTHGSAIFGPKIGSGFYQNLIGNFDPLTMDRWFMRTWGRLTGELMQDPNSKANNDRRAALRRSLSTPKGQQKLAELGYNKLDLANDETLGDIAALLHQEYARTDFKDKSAWNKAGKNLDIGINDTIGAPKNSSQRTWIREVVAEAQSMLKQRGLDVDTATMQALIWYPEKELYLKHGVGDARAKPTDYEQEFASIASARGVDPARIRSILRRKSGRGPRGIRPRESEGLEQAQEQFTQRERRAQLLRAGVTTVRRDTRATYRATAPKARKPVLVGNAKVTSTYAPEVYAKNQWNRVRVTGQNIHELDGNATGNESAVEFHARITAAKEAHEDGAAVYVYPLEEYEGARLFLTQDGLSGFALKGDDIVSVFKHPDSKNKNAMQSMLALAVEQGGRRLDAFDTVLPHGYALQGFKVVSRLAWDDAQAPPGWSKEHFAEYNNGEPDVVFMVWDPQNFTDYTGEGDMVETYDEAVKLQKAERDKTMYPDPGPIRFRIEDEVRENFVDEHPDHPHSVLFKMAATVEDQANYAPSAVEVIKDRVTNLGDKKIEANLEVIHRNYLADFMPDERLNEIDNYNHQIRTMDGRKGELMEQYDETARKMFWHKAREPEQHKKLGEAMFHATITGNDPSKPYKPLKKRENMTEADKKADVLRRAEYKVLKDFFDTQLDQKSRDLFIEVRDQYQHLRQQQQAAIESRIEQAEADGQSKRQMLLEVRRIFEAGRVQGPYFPLDRWGDRWATAYDENGEVYSFSKFDNKSEMVAWKKSMQEAGFTVKSGKRMVDTYSMAQQIDPSLVAKIQQMTAGVPGGEQIADEMYQLYLKSLPEVSMRKQFIHRKGRIGFSENIVRSFASHMFHGATQVARMEIQPQLEDTLRKLRVQVQAAEEMDDEHSDYAVPLYNTMVKRHELAMNPPRNAMATWATSLGFSWLLGVTPGAALLNWFQTPMFALPTLSARNTAAGASKELAIAIGQWWGSRIGGFKTKLRDDELAAYEWAEKTGIFQKTMAHDLADLIDQSEAGDYAYGARRNIMSVISYLFHTTEQSNREVTFMAAYRLARQRGLDHEAAMWEAGDLNDRSHYDYSASNRPPMMQGPIARVLLLFKNYGIHSTYQIARSFKDGFFAQEGLPIEVRREARRKFTGIMMMTGILGGISSLPMAWAVEAILNMIFDEDDEPYDAGNAFKTWLVQDQGWSVGQVNALMNGGWDQLTGGTMSSRISLSYLGLGRESYMPLEGRDQYHHYLEEIAGPVPSILGAPIFAAQDFRDGHIDRGIEKMLPKFARDLMRAFRFQQEGALTYRDEPIMTPEEFTNKDLFLQSMGLVPNRLHLRYEQNRELKNMNTRLERRRTRLMNRMWNAILLQDAEMRRETMVEIQGWNMAHPQWRIGADELTQSARSRARMNRQTYGGTALNPRLDYELRQEMTWLDVETGEPLPRPPGSR